MCWWQEGEGSEGSGKGRKGGNRLTDFQKIGLKEKRGIGQVERLDLT